jgi:hypothetical protein
LGEERTVEPELLQLVYSHAMDQLESQRGTIDDLRGRAGVVLGASSVAGSFLGSVALGRDQSFPFWAALAFISFVVIGICVLVILWPYKWQFGFEPALLLKDYVKTDPPASVAETWVTLAGYAGNYLNDNGRILNRLFWFYRGSILALVLEVCFWLISLGVEG